MMIAIPDAPTFPVGPEMSGVLCNIITKHPTTPTAELARQVGADPHHPFFLADLAVANAWLAVDHVPESRMDVLEHRQRLNVDLALAMLTASAIREAGVDLDGMRSALPILETMERLGFYSDHLVGAIQLTSLVEFISENAGEIDAPIETILRECLEAEPSLLYQDGKIGSEGTKKVLSRYSTKDGTTTGVHADRDHETIDREGEREHGGETDARTGSTREAAGPPEGDERRTPGR